jgi:hypothetical protein
VSVQFLVGPIYCSIYQTIWIGFSFFFAAGYVYCFVGLIFDTAEKLSRSTIRYYQGFFNIQMIWEIAYSLKIV